MNNYYLAGIVLSVKNGRNWRWSFIYIKHLCVSSMLRWWMLYTIWQSSLSGIAASSSRNPTQIPGCTLYYLYRWLCSSLYFSFFFCKERRAGLVVELLTGSSHMKYIKWHCCLQSVNRCSCKWTLTTPCSIFTVSQIEYKEVGD